MARSHTRQVEPYGRRKRDNVVGHVWGKRSPARPSGAVGWVQANVGHPCYEVQGKGGVERGDGSPGTHAPPMPRQRALRPP